MRFGGERVWSLVLKIKSPISKEIKVYQETENVNRL